MHRITTWTTDDGDVIQVAVACLDVSWEPHVEIVRPVGPFDVVQDEIEEALSGAHALGGWRAHQIELPLG